MTRSAEFMRAPATALLLCAALAACSSAGRKPKPAAAEPVAPVSAAPAQPLVDKGDPSQRFDAALKLMKDKQPQEATEAFTQLAKDFPEFSGPLTDLAILQANAKQRPAAIQNFQKAVGLNPQNWVAQNWLGTLQRENGDYAAAEKAYRGALAAKADYAPAHLNLGLLYDVYLKRPQDALNEYREYQRIDGGSKLIVSAWIHELEDRLGPTAPSDGATVPAAPVAPAQPAERKA